MPRPPDPVVFTARTHWVMAAVILVSVLVLYALVRNSTVVELSRQTWAITLGLSALYAVTGTLVWFGAPLGRVLNYLCSLPYLARPGLGTRIWQIASSDEFRAHFNRRW